MHHTKLKKAKGLIEGKEKEEAIAILAENGFTNEEIKEIFPDDPTGSAQGSNDTDEAANSAATISKAPTPAAEKKATEKPKAENPADAFDYKSLTGDEFKKYIELIDSLPLYDMFTVELYRAEPIMKQRFEGLEGSPTDHVGLRLLRDKPETQTHTTIRAIKDYNAQILNAHSRAGHGKYYLLKQTKK